MSFQEISQSMKESKIVRTYIYLWMILVILFGIGIFIYLNSNELFSLWVNILISVLLVIVVIAEFNFNARFLLLAGFIKGNKTTIKFQIGAIILALVSILIFYKSFIEEHGLLLVSAVFCVGILIVIFSFLRLRELSSNF